jgi:hypothetical protein
MKIPLSDAGLDLKFREACSYDGRLKVDVAFFRYCGSNPGNPGSGQVITLRLVAHDVRRTGHTSRSVRVGPRGSRGSSTRQVFALESRLPDATDRKSWPRLPSCRLCERENPRPVPV